MASDGFAKRAKKGTCRICQRARKTDIQVKAVGEVNHGFACGYIWECIDTEDCDKIAKEKLSNPNTGYVTYKRIENALNEGRYKQYRYRS